MPKINELKILVVEDMPEDRLIYERIIKCASLVFCDSEESMYIEIAKQDFNIIIMDVGLPGSKDGVQLISELKTHDAYSKIPVICITSHVFKSVKEKVISAGAMAYLTKPLNRQLLINTIENLS
ncbi:MAG: response regulator [Melioribacteraceae bacterium]